MKALKKSGLLCGLTSGLVNGLLGGGGGIIAVIFLEKVLRLPPERAHANALAIMLPTTVISAVVYTLKGIYSPNIYSVTLGVIVGGAVGSALLCKLKSKALEIIFLGVMIFSAVKMVI